MTDNPAELGASAMILDRDVQVDDQKRAETSHLRIKVLTQDGRDNADIQIVYNAKSESIEGIRARTVRRDGTEIPFDGVVYDKVLVKYKRFRYNTKTFTLPGVEVGSIIEYTFTKKWKDPLPQALHYPELVSEEISYPTATWIVQSTLFTRHARFSFRPEKGLKYYWYKVRLPNSDPVKTPDGFVKLELENVAALAQEDFMPPESTLNSRVHFLYGREGPSGFWGDYARNAGNAVDEYIGKSRTIERTVKALVAPGDSAEVRLRKIYERVEAIRNLSFEPEKTEKQEKREKLSENKSAEDVLAHGYGWGNEVNYLFVAMARAGGFDASIVAVTDRASALFDAALKDTSQLNAIIVRVMVDGVPRYFDPASRFCAYGILPWYETDAAGVRWDKSGAQMIITPPQDSNAAVIKRTAEFNVDSNGELDGRIQTEFSGQEAMERRVDAANEDTAGRLKNLEDQIKGWLPSGATIDELTVNSWDSTEAPLIVKCHVHLPQFASVSAKRIIFPPAIFEVGRTEILRHNKRVHPVYFQHAYLEEDAVSYSIPQGYRLEALPTGFEQSTGFASLHATYSSSARSIQFKRTSDVHGYYVTLQYYAALKRYLRAESESDAKHVVLQTEKP